jgi:hypothetical protein
MTKRTRMNRRTLLLTLLRAVGLDIAKIGDGARQMTAGVSALET